MAALIAILGIASILTMPTDIFQAINIPVVSVVWNYNGIAPDDMANRIVTICERAMTSTVNGIEPHRVALLQRSGRHPRLFPAECGCGLGNRADHFDRPDSAAHSSARHVPPQILKYDASSVPILQLGINSKTLTQQQLADYAQNFVRSRNRSRGVHTAHVWR
jgi:multidrug efflux pump subunit AcrB